jgi:hypothetical protein
MIALYIPGINQDTFHMFHWIHYVDKITYDNEEFVSTHEITVTEDQMAQFLSSGQ